MTEDQLIQNMLLLNNFSLTLSRENMEKIVIDYYFHIFQFRIESALFHLFQKNDNSYLDYLNVQSKYIDGSLDLMHQQNILILKKSIRIEGYAEDITKQIKNLKEFESISDVLIITPNKSNNYSHDFYILTANVKNRKLFAFQVDTNINLDKEKLSNGYETCFKMQKIFKNIKVEYFFITHKTNNNFSENVKGKYNIIQSKLLSRLMILNNNADIVHKKADERRKGLIDHIKSSITHYFWKKK